MTSKRWIRTAGSFISGVLFLVGLAGIPQDVATWQRWLSYAQQRVPWWAFIGTSVLLALIVWGPWIYERWWKRRGQRDPAIERLAVLFRNTGENASEKAYALLLRICGSLREDDARSAQSYLGTLIERFVGDSQRASRSGVSNFLKRSAEARAAGDSLAELQRLVGDYYEKYQWMVTSIHRGGELAAFPFGSDEEYRQWRTADDEFLRELRRVVAGSEHSVLDERVRAVGWGENFRKSPARMG